MQKKEEGFEESDHEHLPSKARDQGQQSKTSTQDFYKIPDAKPILSKNIIDFDKPKVLIREIEIYQQPPQLISASLHKQIFSSDKNHLGKHHPNLKKVEDTTLWNKYINPKYRAEYFKFYRQNIHVLQKKGFKKYKVEIQRLSKNDSAFFATYLIDLSFLSDYGNCIMRNLKPISLQQINISEQDNDVQFDSRFQCGNLFAVFKKNSENSQNLRKESQYEADLVLQSDINTKGYSNWFYFSVKSKKKKTFKFNIVNMQKMYSLYTAGMKIVVYSKKRQEKQGIEWHRDGYNYMYYKNEILKNEESTMKYNTLSFCFDQKYEDDVIYFATNLPYSYSKLINYIDSIEKTAKLNSNIYFKKEVIASTISSNHCPILTLTWKRDKKKDIVKKKKKIIGIIARQHPSQTVSSYVMEGFLNSLVHMNNQYSVYLLQNYIFKIVPMVNIDGVLYGNSRCDITGNDINRKWTRNPNKSMYPIISATRNMFNRLRMEEYEIDYFIDFHGHSRKLGAFFYACRGFDDIESRETAWIMSRLNSKFLFEECSFGLSHTKRETARGIMSDLALRKKSMTLEASFYGYRNISNKHFQVKDLHKIGSSIAETIFYEQSRDPKLFNWETIKVQIKQAIVLMKKAKKQKQNQQSSDGSDSNPEQDQMTQKQKSQLFLDPVIATKIGLVQVKIVEKRKGKSFSREHQRQRNKRFQPIIDGFNEKIDELVQQKSTSYQPTFLKFPVASKNEEKIGSMRQTKSTTKIAPFKLSQKQKSLSIDKKNRKTIDLLKPKPQKLSMPELPKVQIKKNNFLLNLKKEFKSLAGEICEKKIYHLNRLSHR